MKNSPTGKELHHPIMTWSYFQRSVDSWPHSHPFQTGCTDPQHWETSMAPFHLFNLNCSGSLLSHSLFMPAETERVSSFSTVHTCVTWQTRSYTRLRVLTAMLFAAVTSHHRCAQLHFHAAAAASGTVNHTEYFCSALSVALHIYKSPLTLTSTSSSPDNPVLSFLLNKMSPDDNPYSTDVIL